MWAVKRKQLPFHKHQGKGCCVLGDRCNWSLRSLQRDCLKPQTRRPGSNEHPLVSAKTQLLPLSKPEPSEMWHEQAPQIPAARAQRTHIPCLYTGILFGTQHTSPQGMSLWMSEVTPNDGMGEIQGGKRGEQFCPSLLFPRGSQNNSGQSWEKEKLTVPRHEGGALCDRKVRPFRLKLS